MSNDLVSLEKIILRIKEKRDEQSLSYDDINELIQKNGDYPLSKSTLSRIFAEGSEEQRFSYEDTIRPLAKALLDIENIEEDDTDDVKTLKALLKLKMQRINELEAELAKAENKYHEKIDKEREQFHRSLDFLKEQVAYKDKRMDLLLSAVKEKDTMHNKLLEHILSCPYKGCKQENKNED